MLRFFVILLGVAYFVGGYHGAEEVAYAVRLHGHNVSAAASALGIALITAAIAV
jgi:hypothetical protein